MYWGERYQDDVEHLIRTILIISLISVLIWVLNGGKNDFGVVHHIVIYMMLTNMVCVLLIGVAVVFMALHDLVVWLLK